MRILVTGANGMLGHDLIARLALEHSVIATDRDTLDVTSADAVKEAVRGVDAVVNCAAWTAVDDAESSEDAAFLLNAVAPHFLASAAANVGARLVQVSTDYVFNGTATTPYREDALMRPTSAYGRTKAAGEWAVRASGGNHLIVRTAWLYGAHGPSFPRTMARLAGERDTIDVVTDQVGQPTWTVDVADVITQLLESRSPSGVYHATSSGIASWFEFARAVMQFKGLEVTKVRPTDSTSFVRPAPRPSYSVLGHDALSAVGLEPIADWRGRWAAAAATVLGAP